MLSTHCGSPEVRPGTAELGRRWAASAFHVDGAGADLKTMGQCRWRKGQRDSQPRVQSQVPDCQQS